MSDDAERQGAAILLDNQIATCGDRESIPGLIYAAFREREAAALQIALDLVDHCGHAEAGNRIAKMIEARRP